MEEILCKGCDWGPMAGAVGDIVRDRPLLSRVGPCRHSKVWLRSKCNGKPLEGFKKREFEPTDALRSSLWLVVEKWTSEIRKQEASWLRGIRYDGPRTNRRKVISYTGSESSPFIKGTVAVSSFYLNGQSTEVG